MQWMLPECTKNVGLWASLRGRVLSKHQALLSLNSQHWGRGKGGTVPQSLLRQQPVSRVHWETRDSESRETWPCNRLLLCGLRTVFLLK